jgi:hypothetical protein
VKTLSPLLLLSATLVLDAAEASAFETIAINQTDKAPLFDGRCSRDEWQAATKIELPALVSVYLMHDQDSFFVCAKGKAEDYTVIDLYIEHAETGQLHNLHASAQLGERLLTDKAWSESEFWNLEGWGGFWVPYAGNEESEDGMRTKFLKGSHREIQVLRKKFAGNTWNMMIGVSAVNHEGKYGAEFFYPESAVDTDESTWGKFSFSKSGSIKD